MCICTRVCISVCVCMCTFLFVVLCVHMGTRVYISVCVRARVCMSVSVCALDAGGELQDKKREALGTGLGVTQKSKLWRDSEGIFRGFTALSWPLKS